MNLMGLFGDVLDEDVNTQRGESGIAPYLLLLLTAVFPQGMRAHEQSYVRPDNKLVEFEYASKISPLVSGVVFFREFMFGPGSRKHEFGHRIQTALASQEWDIRLVAIEGVRGYSSQEIKDLALS